MGLESYFFSFTIFFSKLPGLETFTSYGTLQVFHLSKSRSDQLQHLWVMLLANIWCILSRKIIAKVIWEQSHILGMSSPVEACPPGPDPSQNHPESQYNAAPSVTPKYGAAKKKNRSVAFYFFSSKHHTWKIARGVFCPGFLPWHWEAAEPPPCFQHHQLSADTGFISLFPSLLSVAESEITKSEQQLKMRNLASSINSGEQLLIFKIQSALG